MGGQRFSDDQKSPAVLLIRALKGVTFSAQFRSDAL
jgi:hypothetical protein